MSSQFKKAHKLHDLAQQAGALYPHVADEGLSMGSKDEALRLYAELSIRVPDPQRRSTLLGVESSLVDSWEKGERIPLLRAHRKALRRALRRTSDLDA
jgi:hypothetical protein